MPLTCSKCARLDKNVRESLYRAGLRESDVSSAFFEAKRAHMQLLAHLKEQEK